MGPISRTDTKNLIKQTVKNSIVNYAKAKLKNTPKFQILDLIIPNERRIRSIVGGLETSMGTTLWEPLAKALARNNGFEVIDTKLQCPANMPASLANSVSTIIDDRKNKKGIYDALSSKNEIINICRTFIKYPIDNFIDAPQGFGVDIWLRKNSINYLFDTKTVQPNLGTLQKCLEQVINWYAYFYSRYPQSSAEGRIVFPYNPYKGNFWKHIIGQGKPLEQKNEAWVEDEFWDFCSGHTNTYNMITEAFNELHSSGELRGEFYGLFYA